MRRRPIRKAGARVRNPLARLDSARQFLAIAFS